MVNWNPRDLPGGGTPDDVPQENPPWATLEFWLAIIGPIVAVLLANNVFPDGSTIERVLTIIMTIISALGYQAYSAYTHGVKLKMHALRYQARLEADTVNNELAAYREGVIEHELSDED